MLGMTGVVGIDQVTKAVQRANHFVVNTGGAAIVPSTAGDFLWRSEYVGAIADTVAAGALFTAAGLIASMSSVPRRLGAALIVGGLASNLLDRLGVASLVHPGLPRGSIDWVPLGAHVHANLADAFVAVGTAGVVAHALVRAIRKVTRRGQLNRSGKVAAVIALTIWTTVWGSNRQAAFAHRQEAMARSQLAALRRVAERYPSTGMDWLTWRRPPTRCTVSRAALPAAGRNDPNLGGEGTAVDR
jgi:lipoprotein signal peptidase